MKFGDYLRQMRTRHGWTQPEAAIRAGIEQSYLSKLETGKSVPSSEIYDRLSRVYGINNKALVDVLFPAELDRLREIDSLREMLLDQAYRQRSVPRRWLAAGLVALALGGGFVGLSRLDPGRSVVTYTYMSDGVLPIGAADDAEPAKHDERTRYLTQMRGPAFVESSGAGQREWHLVGSGTEWQPARFGWAIIPGLGLVFAGLGCFFLAWRWR